MDARILRSCAALAALLALWATPAHASLCEIKQVTRTTTGDSRNPFLSGDGTMLALRSTSNLTRRIPFAGDAIFLYDIAAGRFLEAISSFGTTTSDLPSLDDDGSALAFVSDGDLLPPRNGDRNREIFLADFDASILTQETSSTGGFNLRPIVSGDGARIAFLSNRDLSGSNADLSTEVFFAEAGGIKQVTSSPSGFLDDAWLSRNGQWVSFVSSTDPTGGNPDRSQELFRAATDGSALTQITDTTVGFSFDTSINGDGTRIAFSSTQDLTGDNPDGNAELFLYRADTGAFQQLTDTAGCQNDSARIDEAGTRVVFVTQCSILGRNLDRGPELALYDPRVGILIITDNAGFEAIATPTIDASGTRMAFRSGADLIGDNADGNFEIFQVDCPAITPIPTVPPPALVVTAAALLLAALAALRCRARMAGVARHDGGPRSSLSLGLAMAVAGGLTLAPAERAHAGGAYTVNGSKVAPEMAQLLAHHGFAPGSYYVDARGNYGAAGRPPQGNVDGGPVRGWSGSEPVGIAGNAYAQAYVNGVAGARVFWVYSPSIFSGATGGSSGYYHFCPGSIVHRSSEGATHVGGAYDGRTGHSGSWAGVAGHSRSSGRWAIERGPAGPVLAVFDSGGSVQRVPIATLLRGRWQSGQTRYVVEPGKASC